MGKHTEYVKDTINFDIFGSKEIDLEPPMKTRRKRQVDDYDYNDPFFEPFEGEFDAVDIECNLENFFVYKGSLSDHPKRIAKRYAKEKKQGSLAGKANFEQRGKEAFSFERIFPINTSSKYKKEPGYANVIFWLFCYELEMLKEGRKGPSEGKKLVDLLADSIDHSPAGMHVDYLVLMELDKERWGKGLLPLPEDEKMLYKERLHTEIEDTYQAVASELRNKDNFEKENKIYKNFKSDESTFLFIRFYMLYIKYYSFDEGENVQRSRNRASDYLMAAFSDECTNKIKLKYYVRKAIEDLAAVETDYNLEQIAKGNFTRKGELVSSDAGCKGPGNIETTVDTSDLITADPGNDGLASTVAEEKADSVECSNGDETAVEDANGSTAIRGLCGVEEINSRSANVSYGDFLGATEDFRSDIPRNVGDTTADNSTRDTTVDDNAKEGTADDKESIEGNNENNTKDAALDSGKEATEDDNAKERVLENKDAATDNKKGDDAIENPEEAQ